MRMFLQTLGGSRTDRGDCATRLVSGGEGGYDKAHSKWSTTWLTEDRLKRPRQMV